MVDSQFKFSFKLLTTLRLWLSVVLVVLCLVSPALASLEGSVELIYTDFTADEDGKEVSSLSAFSQNYSFLYKKRGFLGDQRLGSYDVGLGYEWVSSSTKIKSLNIDQDEKFNFDDGKVLFRGMVNIAPGALPFRFNAYSYDMNRPTNVYASTGQLLDSQVIVGTRSREEVHSGLSLMAGIKNGSYLGTYRSILSKLPRIFIDYNQVYIRDVNGIAKEHSLLRDLAFVSLNKKDNWFHYRASDYTDHMDSDNDESDFAIILGTINQGLQRHWINMTNWIDISVDGVYSEVDSPKTYTFDKDPKTFALNFFTRSDYGKTRTSSFSNFRRTTTSDKRDKEYEIPLYANGWIDPNRSWSVQLRRYAYSEDLIEVDAFNNLGDEEGEYLAARFGIGHLDPVKFDSTLELERADKTEPQKSRAFAVRFRQEMSRNVNIKNPWLLGYAGLYLNTDSDSNSSDAENNVFEHEVYGSFTWNVSPRNVFELRQSFRYANSVSEGSSTNFIFPKGGLGNNINQNSASSSDALYSSETSLSLDSRLGPKLTNRLQLRHNSFIGGVEDRSLTEVEDKLIYRMNKWRFEMVNGLYFGDDLPSISVGGSGSDGVIVNESSALDVDYLLSHYSLVEYWPNRNLDNTVKFEYVLKDTDIGLVHRSALNQESAYTFLSFSGRRRLGKIFQEAEYQMYSSDNYDANFFRLLVGASYFPTTYLTLGGEMEYRRYDPQEKEDLALSVMAAMDFQKLSCVTRYSYGVSKFDSDSYDERKEHLFEAKIRKYF